MQKKALTIIACIVLVVQNTVTLVKSWIGGDSALLVALYMIILAFGVVSLFLTLKSEYKGYIRSDNKSKINKKIVDFIKTGKKTIILSRDLSWVTPSIIGQFKEKVDKKDELIVYLPKRHINSVSRQLESFADVRYYDGKHLTSRFTIINVGTDSVRITYPQVKGQWHINKEYGLGDPAFTLAEDIIQLLDQVSSKGKNEIK